MSKPPLQRLIDVDLNELRGDGRLVAAQSNYVPVKDGEHVRVRDTLRRVELDGQVTGISADGSKLYIAVDWP